MSAGTLTPPTANADRAWQIRDAAVFFRVTERTIYTWIKSGRLPAPTRVGSKWLWHPSDLKELISQSPAGA